MIRKLSIQDVKTAVQNFPTASQDHEFGERSFTNITPRVFAVRIRQISEKYLSLHPRIIGSSKSELQKDKIRDPWSYRDPWSCFVMSYSSFRSLPCFKAHLPVSGNEAVHREQCLQHLEAEALWVVLGMLGMLSINFYVVEVIFCWAWYVTMKVEFDENLFDFFFQFERMRDCLSSSRMI